MISELYFLFIYSLLYLLIFIVFILFLLVFPFENSPIEALKLLKATID